MIIRHRNASCSTNTPEGTSATRSAVDASLGTGWQFFASHRSPAQTSIRLETVLTRSRQLTSRVEAGPVRLPVRLPAFTSPAMVTSNRRSRTRRDGMVVKYDRHAVAGGDDTPGSASADHRLSPHGSCLKALRDTPNAGRTGSAALPPPMAAGEDRQRPDASPPFAESGVEPSPAADGPRSRTEHSSTHQNAVKQAISATFMSSKTPKIMTTNIVDGRFRAGSSKAYDYWD